MGASAAKVQVSSNGSHGHLALDLRS